MFILTRRSNKHRALRLCGAVLAVFLFALVFVVHTPAQVTRATTRAFVSATTGNDANPCSRAAPCRDISSAVAAVGDGGEVVVLDSGDFGAVEITKSVQVVAPEGVHAVIAPVTGIVVPGDPNGATTAVLVNAPGATVVMRNIVVQRQGQIDSGIRATSVGALQIENCIVNGFQSGGSDSGIFFQASGRLMVRDTTARNNDHGILVAAPAGGTAHASVDQCRLDGNNSTGLIAASNSRVTVTNTVATHERGDATGFLVSSDSPAELNCDNCTASNLAHGFARAGAGAVMRVARSMATNNDVGFFNGTSGTFKSLRGTNMVDGNGTNRVGAIITLNPDVP